MSKLSIFYIVQPENHQVQKKRSLIYYLKYFAEINNKNKVTFENATIFKEIVAKYKEFITKSMRFHQS